MSFYIATAQYFVDAAGPSATETIFISETFTTANAAMTKAIELLVEAGVEVDVKLMAKTKFGAIKTGAHAQVRNGDAEEDEVDGWTITVSHVAAPKSKAVAKAPAKSKAVAKAPAKGGKAAAAKAPKGKAVATKGKTPAKAAKAKKPKAKRDPNMPKKGLTAYFLWLAEHRAAIKKQLLKEAKASELEGDELKKATSVSEVAKAAGAQWKELSDKEKAPYQKASAKAKAKADEAIATYKAKLASDEEEAEEEAADASEDEEAVSDDASDAASDEVDSDASEEAASDDE
jgi:hypothetical protein